jgi:RHS repeat-associated protein
MRPLRCLCNILFLLVLLPSVAAAQVSLTLGDTTLPAGDSGSVTASISSDGSAVALQFDVLYDPALVSLGTVTGGPALTGNHSIASNPIGPGRDRIVITTSPVTALGSGVLATINLGVDTGAAAGTTPLDWDGVVISDAAAQPITPSSLTPGTITITAAAAPVEPEAIPANPLWSLMLLTALMFLLVRRLRSRAGVFAVAPLLALGLLAASTTAQAQNIPGDANGDGRIDIEDVRLIVERILERGLLPGDGDCNRDSTINVLDTVCSQLPFVPGETAPIILGPGDRVIPAAVPFEMNLFAADPDPGAMLNWELLTGPAGLTVSSTGLLAWTPATADAGDNAVTVRVTDDTARSAEATFAIQVFTLPEEQPENAPPVLTVPDDQTLPVGTPLAASASADDPDAGDDLTFSLISGPSGMTIDPDTGALSWTPQGNQAGQADVVVQVEDEAGATDFGSFIAEATPVNRAPVANDEVYEARFGEMLTIALPGVLTNDIDPDGDPLTAALVDDAIHGELTLNPDGSFNYLVEPSDTATTVELEIFCDNSRAPGSYGSAGAIESDYQTNGTIAVGDVDNDGDIELIGETQLSGRTFQSELWIMNAADCTEEFQTGADFETLGTFDRGHLGLLDIDGDGDLEIIGSRERFPDEAPGDAGGFDGEHLLAVHHDGTPAWPRQGGSETTVSFGEGNTQNGFSDQGPTFADIDGDGTVEIIMASSINSTFRTQSLAVVYNAEDGSIQWEYLSPIQQSASNAERMPYVVDLDLDGTMEIIVHNSVLDHDGQLEFTLPSLDVTGSTGEGHLTLGIGNFDNDAFPEIVGRDNFAYYLFEHDGTITWEFEHQTATATQITVADFDGDGKLEFANPNCIDYGFNCNEYALQVYNAENTTGCTDDCTTQDFLLWEHGADPDLLLSFSFIDRGNITAFDANRDGAADLVYRNDRLETLYIFDGRDGSVLTSVPAGGFSIAQRYVTVADVNGDGHAELINSYTGGIEGQTEIWTGTAANPLPAAPPYRNQWGFNEAYVDADLTIPTDPVPHWQRRGLNGWNLIAPESRLQILCENDRSAAGPGVIDSDFQTNDTVAVGDVDNDGDLELVGTTNLSSAATSDLWLINAADCTEQAGTAGLEPLGGFVRGHSGLLDIDGDGDLEIIGPRNRFPQSEGFAVDREHLLAVHHDGSPVLEWGASGGSATVGIFESNIVERGYFEQGPTFADIDADGSAEVIMAASIGSGTSTQSAAVAYNAEDGSIQWSYLSDVLQSNSDEALMPYVVDLDLDGTMEVIVHNSVIDHNGQLEFVLPSLDRSTAFADGHLVLGIGNFDDDPFPELVGRDNFLFYLFEHDGTKTWEFDYRTVSKTQITVADFDGDGKLEFANINCTRFTTTCGSAYGIQVFDAENVTGCTDDCTKDDFLLWEHGPDSVFSMSTAVFSNRGNLTAFDINQDGAFDLVYRNDELEALYIFDGRNGDALEEVPISGASSISNRFVTVADVNGDGQTELISSWTNGLGGRTKVWTGIEENPLPAAPPYRNQWSFQEAYVNPDLSTPTAPVAHWLRPGLNGWNKLAPVPDPLVGGDDFFTYQASDGLLSSNTATVTLDILPAGNPPEFVSEPIATATRGAPYDYEPVVYDPDAGDELSFRLLTGPTGMTIDPVTGAISWSAGAVGTYPVSIMASDTIGFATSQTWDLVVGDPVTVPDVVGSTEAAAETTLTGANLAKGRVTEASHPTIASGTVISQNPPAGSVAGFGAAVALVLSTGPGPLDADSDNDGFSQNEGDCDDGNSGIFPGAADADGDGIDQDCDGIDGNKTLVAIEITPDSKRVLTDESVPLVAMGIFEDGTAQNLTDIATWSNGPTFSSGSAGNFVAEASFRGITGTADFDVVARVADDEAPLARISSPAAGAEVTAPTDIVGTASDTNLLRWELAYQYAGEESFILFAEGAGNVTAAAIGEFDPTTLLNGLYTIRLQVYDRGGNVSEDSTTVQVEGQMKIGNFTLRYVDLELPLNGIPITVARTYDSRDKRAGDFGVGWRLAVNSIEVGTNRELGSAWRVVKQGLSFGLSEDDLHLAAVRLPDGRIEAFEMVISPAVSPIIPFPPLSQSVSFRPLPGTLGSLEALGENNVSILDAQPGPVTLRLDSDGTIYNPTLFRYTTPDGTKVDLDTQAGIQRAELPGGQQLTFTPTSITHSNGTVVSIERDGAGRITRITDPGGFSQSYGYDANGDLRTHRDQEDFVTHFDYDGQHNIINITDPLNRSVVRNEYDDAGRLVRATDASGNVTTFEHELAGNLERITDPDGFVQIYEYDERGNVTRIVDSIGGVTTNTYDASDNLLSTTNAAGETTTYTYDARDNRLTTTDPLGAVTRFAYDDSDRQISVTDPLGRTESYEYGQQSKLRRIVDAAGNSREFSRDAAGNVVAESDEAGRLTRYEHDTQGYRTAVIDARGNRLELTLDANGNELARTDARGGTDVFSNDRRGFIETVTSPEGNAMEVGFNAAGRLLSMEDAAGRTVVLVEDANERLLSVTEPDGGVTTHGYDGRGNRISTSDQQGRITTYRYDGLGRLVAITFPGSATQETTYDPAGRVLTQTDPNGNVTSYEYDAAGRNTALIDALGQRTEFSYDLVGNLIARLDARGNTTEYRYDALDRLIETRYPDGTSETRDYDPVGNVIAEVDRLGRTKSYTYDPNDNLLTVTDIDGAVTSFAYDANNNRISQTDANGHTTRMVYDANDRLIQKQYPDGSTESYEYDAGNRIARTILPDGKFIDATYDGFGRPTGHNLNGEATESFTYDGAGRLLEATNLWGTVDYTYDLDGRVTRIASEGGHSVSYTYDLLGNRTSIATQLAGQPARTTTYTYDALNRLSTVTEPDGDTTTYGYDPVGNVASITYPNGVVSSFTYDNVNQLTRIEHRQGLTTLAAYDYTLDAGGRRMRVDHANGDSVSYSYDTADRLLRETHRDAGNVIVFEQTFSYDEVGNRLTQQISGQAQTVLAYDSADKLLSAGTTRFAYDANGRLVSRTAPQGTVSYVYDVEGQLLQVTNAFGTVTYGYDANGKRRRRTENTREQNFLLDEESLTGFDQTLVAFDENDQQLAEYHWGDRLISADDGTNDRFYHFDASRNTRLLTDEAGNTSDSYDYDAFGNVRNRTGVADSPYGFAGEWQEDAEGLVFLRARFYDPETGRFISRDPFGGNATDPVSLHRYLYANANPIMNTDPSGEMTMKELGIAIAINVGLSLLSDGIRAFISGNVTVTEVVVNAFTSALLAPVGGGATKIVGQQFARIAATTASRKAALYAGMVLVKAFVNTFFNVGQLAINDRLLKKDKSSITPQTFVAIFTINFLAELITAGFYQPNTQDITRNVVKRNVQRASARGDVQLEDAMFVLNRLKPGDDAKSALRLASGISKLNRDAPLKAFGKQQIKLLEQASDQILRKELVDGARKMFNTSAAFNFFMDSAKKGADTGWSILKKDGW